MRHVTLLLLFHHLEASLRPGGGGSHIDMVYVYVPAFWVTFSRNLV